jgi:PAS domain S-box-containing protein
MPAPLHDHRPLRLLLETTLDAVVVMNSDGTIADWNDRAAELFGWSREGAIGKAMAELIIPAQHRAAHHRGLKHFLETGEGPVLGRRIEISAVRRSGAEFPVELAISPVHNDGRVFFVGCLRDISVRVATQEAMSETAKESERQFQLLVAGVTDYAIYMLDPQGRISSWNHGAERIKGYRAEEVLGSNFSIFYTEEDRRAGMPSSALLRAENEGRFEAEGWRVRKDGTRFWAMVVIDPIHNDGGKLIGFAKVTRDITERHQAQQMIEQARERLTQAQKMEAIGQLTGGVAHDFNNLLMIILGNLETAQRQLGTLTESAASRLQRVIGNAMRGAQRAAMLTQRLLAFSRRQPLSPRALDVNKFIAGAVDFLQRSLGEAVNVEAVGGAGLWHIEVDLNQLEASLLNLAVNARDAMPDGGKLTIETSNAFLDQDYCRANPEVLPGQYVLVAVTDNGTGMSKDVAEHAFEPFFTTKVVGEGTGLGLSQVYGFVKQSGGHVKIYSELGEGTTVKIYLPRLAGAVQLEEPTGTDAGSEGLGETILVVEDDGDVRAYIVEVLRGLNYDVLEAHDANSALGMFERNGVRIDLLLTDVVLPGVNGRELAREMQLRRADIKVLFMTGYSRNAIIHQGRLDPDVELIQKPITQAELALRIRDLLDARLPHRQRADPGN